MRLRFAKRGRLRFTSHRDFQRAFERAVRRAGLPIAFSAGFSPHPRISYAGASPTGAASEAEYLEIALTEERDPRQVADALDEALPAGLDILEAVVAGPGSLADRLQASQWRIELPGVATAALEAAVSGLLAAEEVTVERMTKNGVRRFDARPPVLAAAAVTAAAADGTGPDTAGEATATAGQCAILDLVVRHETPSVRPDDVLSALRRVADLQPPVPPRVTRLAQGPLLPGGGIGDPLAPDRG
jgi:radical SAM-linked protein